MNKHGSILDEVNSWSSQENASIVCTICLNEPMQTFAKFENIGFSILLLESELHGTTVPCFLALLASTLTAIDWIKIWNACIVFFDCVWVWIIFICIDCQHFIAICWHIIGVSCWIDDITSHILLHLDEYFICGDKTVNKPNVERSYFFAVGCSSSWALFLSCSWILGKHCNLPSERKANFGISEIPTLLAKVIWIESGSSIVGA